MSTIKYTDRIGDKYNKMLVLDVFKKTGESIAKDIQRKTVNGLHGECKLRIKE